MTEPSAAGDDAILEARGVVKEFVTFERAPGLRGIVKNFVARERKTVSALAGVDLTIQPGETVGLIGANGAGKTTLVKVLTGIVPATSGDARLFGVDSFSLGDAEKRRLALVMGQKSQLWWDLPPIDSFHLLREIYGVEESVFDERVRAFTRMLDVEDRLGIQLRQLSLGQRMKMEVIGAFLHDPDVVFLDEPTIGLDLVSRETIRGFLVRLSEERGVTYVLTSHDMEDIEETCKRIVILDRGAVAFDGARTELAARVTGLRAIEVHVDPRAEVDLEALREALGAHGAEVQGKSAGTVRVLSSQEALDAVLPALLARLDVRDLSIEREPLEQLVRNMYREAGHGAAAAT